MPITLVIDVNYYFFNTKTHIIITSDRCLFLFLFANLIIGILFFINKWETQNKGENQMLYKNYLLISLSILMVLFTSGCKSQEAIADENASYIELLLIPTKYHVA